MSGVAKELDTLAHLSGFDCHVSSDGSRITGTFGRRKHGVYLIGKGHSDPTSASVVFLIFPNQHF